MEVRSYYATSVETAMAAARGELGPEAMLVQSRQSPPDLQHLGRYEVVFAGAAQNPSVSTASLLELQPRSPNSRKTMLDPPELAPLDLIGRPQFSPQPEVAGFLRNFTVERSSTKTIAPSALPSRQDEPTAILTASIRCAPTLGVSRSSAQPSRLSVHPERVALPPS